MVCVSLCSIDTFFLLPNTGRIYVGFHVSTICLILVKIRTSAPIFVQVHNDAFLEILLGVSSHMYRLRSDMNTHAT
jgi:hypothetical protein